MVSVSDEQVQLGEAFFVAGGTVPPGSPSYVERLADRELFESLTRGEYCYVLNSRQMGKSSLAVRTISRLAESGIECAFVDLTRLGGASITPEQWYAGLLVETGRALGLRTEAVAYYRENRDLGPAQRFLNFFQEVALVKKPGRLVLMIDEIDAIRSLPFPTDELFAGIRNLYNTRTTNPVLNRLTVCLLGAALPSDLISDPRTTPFNIGKRIGLKDFKMDEVRPLAEGLGPRGSEILARVMHWTTGHPYLTQVLCSSMAALGSPTTADVDRIVHQRYLDARARESDTNLADVSNRLLGRGDPEVTDADRADTLSLYGILLRKGIPDDEGNPSAARIKMSGVARLDDGTLIPRNRIYSQVFGRAWIKETMPGQELRRQQKAFRTGVFRTSLVAALIVVILGSFAAITFTSARIARMETHTAQSALEQSRRATNDALTAKIDALNSAAQARKSLAGEMTAELKAKQAAAKEHEANLAAHRSELAERKATVAAMKSATLARESEIRARRLLYSSNMGLASGALAEGSGIQVEAFLNATSPGSKGGDRRGWEFRHFKALLSEAFEYPKQPVGIKKIQFTPSGKILSQGEDGRISVWGSSQSKPVASIEPAALQVFGSIAVSQDGRTLLEVKTDGSIRILSPETLTAVRKIDNHGFVIARPCLSQDGTQLIGLFDAFNRIMDLRTGVVSLPFVLNGAGSDVILLPDGDVIKELGNDLIRQRAKSRQDFKVIWCCPGRNNPLRSIAVSPDGRVAAFADSYGYLQLVDADSGVWLGKALTQSAMVTAIAFSPDGSLVASGSADGVVKVSSVADGAEVRTFRVLHDHISALALTNDLRVAFGTSDGFSGIFSPNSFDGPRGNRKLAVGPISGLAVSCDGRWIAEASNSEKAVRVVDAHSGAIRSVYSTETLAESIDLSATGGRLAIGGTTFEGPGETTASIVNLTSGRKLDLDVAQMEFASVRFSPDGSKLFVFDGSTHNSQVSARHMFQVFDANTGTRIKSGPGNYGSIPGIAFSPDGKFVAVPHNSGTTFIYETSTLRQVGVCPVDPAFARGIDGDKCSAACFTVDGKTLLVGRYSGVIDVYSANTFKRTGGWVAHTAGVTGIQYAPDNRTLITISDDRHVKFWTSRDWLDIGEVQFGVLPTKLAVSEKDDTIYVGDDLGAVHAMRTKGLPLPSMPREAMRQEANWDDIASTATKNGKPILIGLVNSLSGLSGAFHNFLLAQEVQKILSKRFILIDALPSEWLISKGKHVAALPFLVSQFDVKGPLPRTLVVRPSGELLWDGMIKNPNASGRRENPGGPSADWEIDGYVSELARFSPRLTAREMEQLKRCLQVIVRPSGSAYLADVGVGWSYPPRLNVNLTGPLKGEPKFDFSNLAKDQPVISAMSNFFGSLLCEHGYWRDASDAFENDLGSVRPSLSPPFWLMMGALILAEDRGEYFRRLDLAVHPDWELTRGDACGLECTGYGLVAGAPDPAGIASRIQARFAIELADPVQFKLRALYGLVVMRTGRLGEAEASIRRALDSPMIPQSERKLAESWRMLLALAVAERGDLKAAQREYDRAEAAMGRKWTDNELMSGVFHSKTRPRILDPNSNAIYTVIRREVDQLLTAKRQ